MRGDFLRTSIVDLVNTGIYTQLEIAEQLGASSTTIGHHIDLLRVGGLNTTENKHKQLSFKSREG